jgi:hypothetical protein
MGDPPTTGDLIADVESEPIDDSSGGGGVTWRLLFVPKVGIWGTGNDSSMVWATAGWLSMARLVRGSRQTQENQLGEINL